MRTWRPQERQPQQRLTRGSAAAAAAAAAASTGPAAAAAAAAVAAAADAAAPAGEQTGEARAKRASCQAGTTPPPQIARSAAFTLKIRTTPRAAGCARSANTAGETNQGCQDRRLGQQNRKTNDERTAIIHTCTRIRMCSRPSWKPRPPGNQAASSDQLAAGAFEGSQSKRVSVLCRK
eukprot:365200-Chlamydomonas_euryale.AAC.9